MGTFLFIMVSNGVSQITIVGGLLVIIVAATGLGAVFLTRLVVRQFVPRLIIKNRLRLAD